MLSMMLVMALSFTGDKPPNRPDASAECLARVKEFHGAAGAWAVAG